MRKADNLPPSCAVVTKSGSLNFLESPGSVQACDGTALPFLHVSSTFAHRQEVKIALHSLWYHHNETSEWSKITKIQFYKYEQIAF